MDNIFTFNKSVVGFSHISKEIKIPCQDASGVFENELYKIAIVSDGHGDPSCFRSDVGSKTAVDVSMENVKKFADEIINSFNDDISLYNDIKMPKHRNGRIKQLTNSILAKWHEEISKNLEQNPITDEEFAKANRYEEVYRSGNKLPHIFGATLIIALWVKDILLLIQQGDGGCAVFFENGEIQHPIPVDDNCHANITTSLCDDNAHDAIRHCVVNLSQNSVIGCFLGSDGVEDSYLDVKGNDNFYKDLMLKYYNVYDKNKADFEQYLEKYLPEFSELGSADDVSVACIVNSVKMESAIADYPSDIESYKNEQLFDQYNQKVISMTRKHTFLRENMEKAEFELRAKRNELEKSRQF